MSSLAWAGRPRRAGTSAYWEVSTRLRILSALGPAGLALAVSGCGVNEQKVGTAAGSNFVSCFRKTNPTTVAALDQNFTPYTSGKPVRLRDGQEADVQGGHGGNSPGRFVPGPG